MAAPPGEPYAAANRCVVCAVVAQCDRGAPWTGVGVYAAAVFWRDVAVLQAWATEVARRRQRER
eukprot:10519754-Lingulodinium_polyedra.AAC.1